MPKITLPRRTVAAAATVLAAAGVAVVAVSANAATSTQFTVSAVSPNRLPALTTNQVITVTGTGFDEAKIKSVAINGCTAGNYIVQNATTLLFKTDDTCATTSTGVITITDTSNNTVVSVPGTSGGKQALAFIAAPAIATASDTVRPIVTDNTAGLDYDKQSTSALVTGGTVIRVYSKTGVPFVDSQSYKLAASLDGVALTGLVMHTGGDYFTGVTGAHAADAAPVLKITSNGVSKSFSYMEGGADADAGTHDFQYAGSSVKVGTAFGPTKGTNKVVVTGVGFTTSTTLKFGDNTCPIDSTGRTATSLTCTVPAAEEAGPVSVVATTSGADTVISGTSTYTYVSQ